MKKITFVIFIFFILCSNSFAKTIVSSLERLTKESDLIVVGETLSIKEDAWFDKDKFPGSIAEIEVEKVIKGKIDSKKNKIYVRYAGTSKGWVEDQPEFCPNTKSILFLRKRSDSMYNTVGLFSGAVRIDENRVYVWDSDVKNWDGHSGIKENDKNYYGRSISVVECIKRIKKILSMGEK